MRDDLGLTQFVFPFEQAGENRQKEQKTELP